MDLNGRRVRPTLNALGNRILSQFSPFPLMGSETFPTYIKYFAGEFKPDGIVLP